MREIVLLYTLSSEPEEPFWNIFDLRSCAICLPVPDLGSCTWGAKVNSQSGEPVSLMTTCVPPSHALQGTGLISVTCVTSVDYADMGDLCCNLRSWWYLGPCRHREPPQGLISYCKWGSVLMLVAHVTAKGQADALHGLWCTPKLSRCTRAVLPMGLCLCGCLLLQPETMLTSVVWPASKGLACGSTAAGGSVCGLCCHQKLCRGPYTCKKIVLIYYLNQKDSFETYLI